jgi:hypothetical protein
MARDNASGKTQAVLIESSISHNVIEVVSPAVPGKVGLLLSSRGKVRIVGNCFGIRCRFVSAGWGSHAVRVGGMALR